MGFDRLHGDEGIDTADYNYLDSEYRINITTAGVVDIYDSTDLLADSDLIFSIEKIQGSNQTMIYGLCKWHDIPRWRR